MVAPENSPKSLRAVGYLRISNNRRGETNGLDSQRAQIEAEAVRQGWALEFATDAGKSAKSIVGRTELQATLAKLAAGEADILVVAKLDRLIRSVADFARIVEAAHCQKWSIVALDLAVDITTPQGEFMAYVMAATAQFERRLIGQRTKAAMGILRAKGMTLGGAPRKHGPAVVNSILALRAEGLSIGGIAFTVGLSRSTVQSVLDR